MNPVLHRLPVVCYVLILAAIVARFSPVSFTLPLIPGFYQLLFVTAHLFGLFYIYRTGRLRRHPMRVVFLLFIPLYMIGALMKLQHWQIGNWFMPAVLAALALCYACWTLNKTPRTRLDLVKLAYIVFSAVRGCINISHAIPREMRVLPEMLGLAFLALLVYLNDQQIRRQIRNAKTEAFYNELQ